MAKKKNVVIEDNRVDKLENLLQNYFKQIIIGVGVLIVLVLVAYLGVNSYKGAKSKDAGNIEIAALNVASAEDIPEFASLVNIYPSFSDYINLTTGFLYFSEGDMDNASAYLSKVSGNYEEIALYVSSDLGNDVDYSKYLADGNLSSLWYYKSILATDNATTRSSLVADFKGKYPESMLINLLASWGIN